MCPRAFYSLRFGILLIWLDPLMKFKLHQSRNSIVRIPQDKKTSTATCNYRKTLITQQGCRVESWKGLRVSKQEVLLFKLRLYAPEEFGIIYSPTQRTKKQEEIRTQISTTFEEVKMSRPFSSPEREVKRSVDDLLIGSTSWARDKTWKVKEIWQHHYEASSREIHENSGWLPKSAPAASEISYIQGN